jgi:hypothetical protein
MLFNVIVNAKLPLFGAVKWVVLQFKCVRAHTHKHTHRHQCDCDTQQKLTVIVSCFFPTRLIWY